MSLAHGLLLHDQGKLDEAEKAYREHLSSEPNDDYAHSRLALCLLEQEGRKKEALKEIDAAIGLEPEHDYYHGVKSIILAQLNKGKQALESADRAIALNPDGSFNHTAKASAFADLMRWSEAETSCRKALSLDSDNGFAKNLLASVLQAQGKSVESEMAVDQLLADDPESSLAHTNAGWAALRRHDYKNAEIHFREALRLDPEYDPARDGLLESFKARSAFYRVYLRYTFFMARFTEGKQWIFIIGIYLIYQFGRHALRQIHPFASGAFICLYLGFVTWVWLAPGIGNFLVMLDRSARFALKKGEKLSGIFVGGGLLLGLGSVIGGLIANSTPPILAGMGLVVSTIPASLTFGNPSKKGRFVFGGVLAFVYLATVGVTLAEIANPTVSMEDMNPMIGLLGLPALIAALLCTWFGNISSLREDDSG
ncbi:MAG: tetratricopeptide repeat protein [Verrucomicrobiales bacterium]|nr:tetratricopeptide repeat protein [Verrucomicrobiales bacterium]